jgi:tetratricopeptide (TPR) repeat protein
MATPTEIRIAITRVVVRGLVVLAIVDLAAFFTGMALTDGNRTDPHITPTPLLIDMVWIAGPLAFLVVGTIEVVRLRDRRRAALARLVHEPLLILLLVIALVNMALLAATWLVPPASQLAWLTNVGLLGVALFIIGLVQRTRAARAPHVFVDTEEVAAARSAVTGAPGSAAGWSSLATALSQSGRTAEAAAASEELVRLLPDEWSVHAFHSELLDAWRITHGGLAAAREAVRLAPDESVAHEALGNALLNRGQRREARAAFQTALGIDPMNAGARNNLAVADLAASPAAAAVGFTEVARMDPMHDLVTRNLRVSLGRLLGRSWYLIVAAGILTLVVVGGRSRLGWTELDARLVLGGIDVVLLGVLVVLFWRTLRSGRLRSLLRFAAARDRGLVALGWILLIGLAALIAVALLPPVAQILVIALLAALFVTSQFVWLIWSLNLRAEATPTPGNGDA